MNALFTFTIGPVKSFVENGRRMGDLYAGSRILSELTKKVIAYLKDKGVYVVFPVLPNNGEQDAVHYPNRLVAKISNFDKEMGRLLASDLECEIKGYFKVLGEEALENVFRNLPDKTNLKAEACAQLIHFLEIDWLFNELR